ncbi:hypothetical protein [Veillonella sp.]|uniref:hypothetical protein n=1 Tax=Veillonella sp. TaxID=1926307 RepID=UPI0025EFC6F8|nr:hypothetical protein [Veillonella sp.]
MDDSEVYLDTYILQKDMRIRLPKAILSNLHAEKGLTLFDIYYHKEKQELILKIHKGEEKK